jgi:hypothetical protein
MGSHGGAIAGTKPVRAALVAIAIAGAITLVFATFSTVIEIRVGAATRLAGADTQLSGWDRHGPALLVIAVFATVLAVVALRGSRPAMLALAALGLAAVLIAAVSDGPDLHATGFIGEVYADAVAGPSAGFYLETLGGVLLLASGGLMLAGAATGNRRSARVKA